MLSLRTALFASCLLCLSGLAGLSGAWAQAASSATSSPSDAAASSPVVAQPTAAATQSDSIDQQIAAWTQAPPASGDGLAKNATDGAAPRQIHGEAGVSIGSNGYRSGYVATEIPIGSDSTLGLAVGESEFKPKHYGAIKDKSLAISLSIGDGSNAPPPPCQGDTIRVDGQYMEPLWVAHARGAQLARDQMSCAGPIGNAAE